MPYAQVSATLERILGFRQSVHSLERSQREAAREVEAFWQEQPPPPPGEEGPLLVCSADGKGVPMRQPSAGSAGPEPAQKGPRPGSKKMALLGAVYTIAPLVRTPQEVLEALFREPGPTRAEPLAAVSTPGLIARPGNWRRGEPRRPSAYLSQYLISLNWELTSSASLCQLAAARSPPTR